MLIKVSGGPEIEAPRKNDPNSAIVMNANKRYRPQFRKKYNATKAGYGSK